VVNVKHLKTFCAALLFTGFASSARADLIVVNANDYPLGTDLSAVFAGVSMSKLVQSAWGITGIPVGATTAPVYAISTYHDPTVLSFGGMADSIDGYLACTNNPSSWSCGQTGYSVLELRFDQPTDFVQLSGLFFSDAPSIMAFDTAGNQIAGFGGFGNYVEAVTFGVLSNGSSITLARNQRDVARVVYGGVQGVSTPTQVSYKVPEPTTLGFLAVGLLSAGLLRARSSSSRRPANRA